MNCLHIGVSVLLLHLVQCNTDNELNSAVIEHVLNEANKPIELHLEAPVNTFTGRIAELSELKLGSQNNKINVIIGERGIGKTQLVLKYLQNVKHESPTNILWLNAINHELLLTSFKDILVRIGQSLEDKQITTMIRETFSFFTNRASIFIFDHASSDNVILKNLRSFVSNFRNIKIFITSRNDDWGEEDFKVMNLTKFMKEDSLRYLKTVLKDEIDLNVEDKKGAELADLLDHLPLALSYATKYIIQKNTVSAGKPYTLDDYIAEFLQVEMHGITTTIVDHQPTDEELEASIVSKIAEEAKRIGDQVCGVGVKAWEKLVDKPAWVGNQLLGLTGMGKKVSDDITNTGKQIINGFAGPKKNNTSNINRVTPPLVGLNPFFGRR